MAIRLPVRLDAHQPPLVGAGRVPPDEHVLALRGDADDLQAPIGDRPEEVLEVRSDLLGAATGRIGEALDGVVRPEEPERLDVVVVHPLDGPADEVSVRRLLGKRCGSDGGTLMARTSRRSGAHSSASAALRELRNSAARRRSLRNTPGGHVQ